MAERANDAARYLAEARAGSRDALGQALELCRAYLLRVANDGLSPELRAKAGASDLVQDTFLEAQRDFAQFQGGSETELLAWLRQMLVHNAANFARRYRDTGKRQIGLEVSLQGNDSTAEPHPAPDPKTPTPSREAMAHETAEAIQKALERIPAEYRQIIVLRNQERRTFEEIGPLMDRSPYAARRLWAKAIERLQQELETPS
jgi:RNA polymerase sigma-70 factor (ECF subfamily)